MKKLMIAAAAAAMVGAAEAAATAYDVTMTVKSTAAAQAKVSSNPYVEKGDTIVYRKQASYNFKGLIWGCDCDAIAGEWKVVAQTAKGDSVGGNVLWDTKTKTPIYIGNDENKFGWVFLNAINKDGMTADGTWAITALNDDGDVYIDIYGAGFGKLANDGCGYRVANMSGNFAGYMTPACFEVGECLFCEDTTGCIVGDAWDFCQFCDDNADLFDDTKTAAYGTWKVAYNSSVSKKLANSISITEAYSFKKLPLVEAAIAACEKEVRGEVDPVDETCSDLKAQIDDVKGQIAVLVDLISGKTFDEKNAIATADADAVTELGKKTFAFTSYNLYNTADARVVADGATIAAFNAAYVGNTNALRQAADTYRAMATVAWTANEWIASAGEWKYDVAIWPAAAPTDYSSQTNAQAFVDAIKVDMNADLAKAAPVGTAENWAALVKFAETNTVAAARGATPAAYLTATPELTALIGAITAAGELSTVSAKFPAAPAVTLADANALIADDLAAAEKLEATRGRWDAAYEACGLKAANDKADASAAEAAAVRTTTANMLLWQSQKTGLESQQIVLENEYKRECK